MGYTRQRTWTSARKRDRQWMWPRRVVNVPRGQVLFTANATLFVASRLGSPSVLPSVTDNLARPLRLSFISLTHIVHDTSCLTINRARLCRARMLGSRLVARGVSRVAVQAGAASLQHTSRTTASREAPSTQEALHVVFTKIPFESGPRSAPLR